jgi:hypothetical protein
MNLGIFFARVKYNYSILMYGKKISANDRQQRAVFTG